MIDASVFIICFNEEKHIERVLKSVQNFMEVVIVDSGSSDKTLEIARQYTDKIFHQDWLGFAGQKEFAKNLCSSDWVLNLDADEQVTPELEAEIVKTIKENKIDGLDIKISSLSMGKFNHKLCKFNRRIRFFRKELGFYPEKLVHESITVKGKVKDATGFIFDYGSANLHTHLEKINEYSSLRAEEKAKKNKKPSLVKLLLVAQLAFFKSYIIKRNFLNGVRGFISSCNVSYYAFLKEAKLFEKYLEKSANKS